MLDNFVVSVLVEQTIQGIATTGRAMSASFDIEFVGATS